MKTKILLTAFLLMSSLSNWAQLPSYIPANGLVAWYPFNANANDESGNGNNGSANGGEFVSNRLGESNKAFSLIDPGNSIQVNNLTNYNYQNNFAISFWIYIQNLPASGEEIIFSQQTNSSTAAVGFNVSLASTGQLNFRLGNGSISTFSGVLFNQITLNQWTQVVCQHANGLSEVFVNSVLSNNFSQPNAVIGTSGTPLLIGNATWIANNAFNYNGIIDDIGIWNRALTIQEINSLYSLQAPCQNTSSTTAATITEGESYSFNGESIETAGTYLAYYSSIAECDSIISLNLNVAPQSTQLICNVDANENYICVGGTVDISSNTNDLSIGNWDQVTDFPNGGVSFPFCFTLGGKVYIGSGYDENENPTTNNFEFSPESNIWLQKSIPPFVPRMGSFSFSIGDFGYVGSGSINGGANVLIDFWRYDPSADLWTEMAEFPGPGRIAAAALVINNKAYIVSGINSAGNLRDCWEYDPISNSWLEMNQPPSGFSSGYVTGFSYGAFGYVGIGGFNGNTNNDFWRFDPVTNSWAQLASLPSSPTKRTWCVGGVDVSSGFGFVGLGGSGGLVINGTGRQNIYSDFWIYDFQSNTWSESTEYNFPYGLVHSKVFNINDELYIGTGLNYNVGSPMLESSIYKFSKFNNSSVVWSTGETTSSISVSPTVTTTYSVTVTQGGQTCTSEVTIAVNQPSSETVNASITEGETYSFNGQNLTTSGTYTATLQNAAGCDSVVTLNLTVEPAIEPLNCEITASEANVCAGEIVALNINGIANSTGLAICSVEALPENLQQGLVGFYPFCGNANDVSINANNGEVSGAVFSTDRFDNSGSSLELDGNDYVTIQPVSALNGLTNYTISAWIKQNNMPIGRGVIFSNWVNNTIPTGSPINNILWANQNRVQLALRAGQESTTLPISDFNNNWINITAVYDGSNPNALSRLKFYINGIETAIDCGFTSANCNHPSSLGLIANEGYIGARRVANSIVEFFNGKIDDLFLFNRSLSIEEVVQISSLSGNSSSILWSTGETTPSISVSPTETTTYSVTVTQGNQTCTSDVTITVNQPSASTVNATITEGESYSFNGQNLTTAGTYTSTLQNAAGCDSLVTLNLTVNPVPVDGCYAATVVNFGQGQRADAANVAAIRSNPEQALGMPEPVVTNVVNFVSLGFGGSITLAFEAPIANGNGADIRIDEATWGNNPCDRYPESADVFASQDGSNFIYLGRVCQDAELDLGPLSWAQYVRIVDASDLLSFNADADGYDVNGISCLNGAATSLNNDGLVACSLQEVVSYQPGTRKNGTAVGAPRNNATNALGMPQNNTTINFVALGFGGVLEAKFDYVVFNQPGNELRVTETSFGNPSCNNYPEKARVSVSMDNVTWTELGEICQDGELDLGTLPYAQYIRIQDASPMSSNKFNGSADGFDVDAVVVLNNGCGMNSARLAALDNTQTADEEISFSLYPNPMEDYTILRWEGLDTDAAFRLELFDAAGRIVRGADIEVRGNEYLFRAADLAPGVYQVVISNEQHRFSARLLK